jgi:hypothetical protein
MLGSWGTADPRRLLLSLFFERRERLLVPSGTWTPVEEMSSPGAMPEEPRVGRHYVTTGPLERSNCRIHLRGRCRDEGTQSAHPPAAGVEATSVPSSRHRPRRWIRQLDLSRGPVVTECVTSGLGAGRP